MTGKEGRKNRGALDGGACSGALTSPLGDLQVAGAQVLLHVLLEGLLEELLPLLQLHLGGLEPRLLCTRHPLPMIGLRLHWMEGGGGGGGRGEESLEGRRLEEQKTVGGKAAATDEFHFNVELINLDRYFCTFRSGKSPSECVRRGGPCEGPGRASIQASKQTKETNETKQTKDTK